MRAYQLKRKRRPLLLYSVFFLLLLLSVFALNAVRGVYATYTESRIVREGLQSEYDTLLQKQVELESELAILETERGEEEEIRERFRVARPDEKLAIILPTGPEVTKAQSVGGVSRSWFSRIFDWFKFGE